MLKIILLLLLSKTCNYNQCRHKRREIYNKCYFMKISGEFSMNITTTLLSTLGFLSALHCFLLF